MDVESIAVHRSHACTRKMFILDSDGKTSELWEFTPCIDIEKIASCYVKSFKHCQRHVHQLPYYPSKMSPPCCSATQKLASFVRRNSIQVIFYKGGILERNLCAQINVPSFNIEFLNVPKVNSHDPVVEVKAHYQYLMENYRHLLLL